MSVKITKEISNNLNKYDAVYLTDSETMAEAALKTNHSYHPDKDILVLIKDKHPELVSLYHTYEFSDHFKEIGRSEQYGTLFNYLDTGILTEDEVMELILGIK